MSLIYIILCKSQWLFNLSNYLSCIILSMSLWLFTLWMSLIYVILSKSLWLLDLLLLFEFQIQKFPNKKFGRKFLLLTYFWHRLWISNWPWSRRRWRRRPPASRLPTRWHRCPRKQIYDLEKNSAKTRRRRKRRRTF